MGSGELAGGANGREGAEGAVSVEYTTVEEKASVCQEIDNCFKRLCVELVQSSG